MIGRAKLVHSKAGKLGILGFGVASTMLAFFVLPFGAYAADLHTLESVDVGGAHITNGGTVSADSIGSLSSYWNFNFDWPNFVPGSRGYFAVIRGTVGNLEGGTLQFNQNFSYQSEAITAGTNNTNKQYGVTQLGTPGLTSGTYTAVIAEMSNPGTIGTFFNWLEAGGTDPAGIEQYATLTFTYDATSHPTEIPDAIHTVSVGGRAIHSGDEVFRKELSALNGSTDSYWNFNFDWPNFVQNQAALFMVFRGTYGNLDGGSPQVGVNYGSTVQAWASGNNDISKFINLPALKDASTTASQYTVMIAERDPKFLDQPIEQQALWFSSGGTQGIAPKTYSLQTFAFMGDEPYPVIIVPGILGSAENNGEWVLDPYLHTYDNLVETLLVNGYEEGQTLFKFPYNWRSSNMQTALLLRDKINVVQSVCHCQKVDLVAHSMGGLVSRQYIQNSNYEGDIDHMIFLGTPHLGAPKDYLMWEGGDLGTDSSPPSMILKLVLTLEAVENGYANLFQYIQNQPIESVRELLPVYSYLFDEYDQIKIYPNQYPTNPFLQNLRLNLDELFSSGVQVTNIAGDNGLLNTITSVDVKSSSILPFWPDGMPSGLLEPLNGLGLNYGDGDGTVPYVSAASLFPGTITVNGAHNILPTSEAGEVYKILTGKDIVASVNKPLINRLLMFRIFSPADLTIIDPQGRRIGRDGMQEINEIPGAFYTGFDTNTEYMVIPNPQDGEYKVNALGTGIGGQYTVATNYITETGTAQKEVTGTIAPNQSIDSVVALNTTAADPLVVHGTDIDPPVITITSPLQQDYLHSDSVPVIVTVADTDSGVATKIQKWDGVATTTTSFDFFYTGLGTHTFNVSATDVAGNATTSSVQVNVVTTPESAILDVNRAFVLGWVKKANIRDTLVQKINNSIKIEKKIITLTEQLPGKPKVAKKIEKLQSRLDKILGVNVVKELDTQLGKGNITQRGYDVIKADIQWLLIQP